MREFLAMGGYAFYVWMSFGLTFVVLTAITFGTLYQRRRAIESVKRTALVAKRRDEKSTSENDAEKGHQ